MMFLSVLFPTKGWFAPDQPINVRVDAPQPIVLVLTDFTGKQIDPKDDTHVPAGESTVDLRTKFTQMSMPGTYVLFAAPQGAAVASNEFLGTPLVIGVREDRRRGAPRGPMIVRVEPLCYAVLHTEKGNATAGFYYETAQNTEANYEKHSLSGFYDG